MPADTTTEPGRARRELLRTLVKPWSLGFYMPFLGIWTLVVSSFGTAISVVSQRANFQVGAFWAWGLIQAAFTRVHVVGRENIDPDRSYIIMSNHQSQFDILAFYGYWRHQFRWVLKEELRKVPGIGWFCAAGGHLFIDRSSREKAIASLKKAAPLLKGGISVMIFPEGTRSTSGRLLPFKKGGFMLALDMGLPIMPVSISGSRLVAPNHSVSVLPGTIKITAHPAIDTASYGMERREELMAEVRRVINSGLSEWEQGGEESGS